MSTTTTHATWATTSARSVWRHRRDVQGLRALAVILVVAHHAGAPITGGFIGVDVFFVISGFVITGLLLEDGKSTGWRGLGDFYVRRAHRLLPALGLVTTVTVLVGLLLLSPLGVQEQTGLTGVAASFSLSNLALYRTTADYFSPDVASNPLLHTWSLGVEEQFYLVFPVVLLGAGLVARRTRQPRRRVAALVVTAILVGSFVASLLLTYGWVHTATRPTALAFYSSPTRAWEFAIGALLAVAGARRWSRTTATVVATTGLLVLGYGVATLSGSDPYPGWPALYPALGTAALLAAGSAGQGTFADRILGHRAMVYVGDISYSWYLWHWPFLVFATRLWPGSLTATVLAVPLSFGAAALTSRTVEQRYRLHTVGTRRRPGALVAAVAVPAALSALMLAGSSSLWHLPQLQSLRQVQAQPVKHLTCLADAPASARRISQCTWGAQRSGPPIYLVGDSTAQQYSEGVIAAGEALGRPVVVVTRGSCLTVLAQSRSDEVTGGGCLTFVQDLLTWLPTQPAGTVVVAGSTENAFKDSEGVRSSGESPWAAGKSEKAQVLEAGLESFLMGVTRAGHAAVLVESNPHLPGTVGPWWSPVDCATWTLLQDVRRCSPTIPLDELDRRDALWLAAQAQAARAARVPMVSVRDDLCPDHECSAFRGGVWVYRDGVHITPARSEQMGGLFTRALERVSPS